MPAGPLCLLPFELLVERDDRGQEHYLIEKHRIRYAPSFTVLDLVRKVETASKSEPPVDPFAITEQLLERLESQE